MKNLILFLLFIVGITNSMHSQHKQHLKQTKISDDLYYNQISDSIFMITHYFPHWGGNNMFILLPNNKGVLIDTPYENTGTESLLNWISNRFGKIDLTVIVTGFHQDNLGGNEILISKGIDVYGADLTKKLVLEQGDSFKNLILKSVINNKSKKYFDSYSNLNLTPPNKTFPIQKGLKLKIENELFEVYFPGESHTIDNTVVYLHHNKILFGGCMFKGFMYKTPGYLGFANINEWPKSIEKVIKRFPDSEIVIPGHGDYGNIKILNHSLKIVNEYIKKNSSK